MTDLAIVAGPRDPRFGVPDAARDCPLEQAIHTVSGRWKMLLLRALFLGGEQRFNALLRAAPGISAKELTRNLRELEQSGLVVRAFDKGGATYGLSPLGETMLPVFRELGAFGARLRARQDEARRVSRAIEA
ncbi:helix-turn-helix domain-containing protein [Caulobacter sp. UNC279MFTsu5.1]|uniref:winged helix-turn-helix transcriptional regulator n=1 Tax=Caulobacter sp. UNC279MFTsu5.1 TaxID=1502775 RepID=UPI0008E70A94|nr:helix-turn-helix domain-containing protein [Caulobacter sp. UNC279MFTsu5.1]SFK43949.1 transcriptional regulator, HxlR family [Caulobacter sp. UNC279MFTsu5.1]